MAEGERFVGRNTTEWISVGEYHNGILWRRRFGMGRGTPLFRERMPPPLAERIM
jgi:hypothetical protein